MPPANEHIVFLDGVEWHITETRSGNKITRSFVRTDKDLLIPSKLSLETVIDFFDRNRGELGISGNMGIQSYYSEEYRSDIIVVDMQYCYGIPVMGTFAGALTGAIDGEGKEVVTSFVFSWYGQVEIDTIEPNITKEEALEIATQEEGGEGDLVIIPTKDDKFKLVWDIKNKDGKHTYVDALTGESKKNRETNTTGKSEPNKITILLVVLGVFLISLFIVILYTKKKKS